MKFRTLLVLATATAVAGVSACGGGDDENAAGTGGTAAMSDTMTGMGGTTGAAGTTGTGATGTGTTGTGTTGTGTTGTGTTGDTARGDTTTRR